MNMNTKLEALKTWGCNTESALERLLEDEELYLEFLYEFTKEPSFDMLAVALDENRSKDAFEYAHMLKGVAANLSIDPLYESLFSLTEALRGQPDCTAGKAEYESVAAAFAEFKDIMAGDEA